MSDLDEEIGFDRPEPSGPPDPEPSPGPESKRAWAWAAIAVVILAAGATWFLLRGGPEPPPIAPDEPAVPATPPPTPEPPPEDSRFSGPIPELDASDELVRELVSGLSSHPKLLTWLARPELVRLFVAAVDNVANEQTPTSHLGFLAPAGAYAVEEQANTLRPSPESYERYDLIATVFASLDPEGTSEAYRYLLPLIRRAYRDLGYPDESFEPTLEQAFANILAVEVPSQPPALVRDVEDYEYRDPRLESATPLEKQLLRMGPENARRIQEQVRRLAAAMDLDVDS